MKEGKAEGVEMEEGPGGAALCFLPLVVDDHTTTHWDCKGWSPGHRKPSPTSGDKAEWRELWPCWPQNQKIVPTTAILYLKYDW